MLTIYAEDEGRLSSQSALRVFGAPIPEFSGEREDDFIRSVGALREPHVLFWHKDPRHALKILFRIKRDNQWPEHLCGVVLFRATPYAGLNDRVTATSQIQSRKLSDEVHIFSESVDSPPSESVVGRIREFSETIADLRTSIAPFWILDPEEHNVGTFTVLLLNRLMSDYPHTEAVILKTVNWRRVRADFNKAGIFCHEELSIETFRAAVAALRESSLHKTTLVCPGCARRQNLKHTRVQRGNFNLDDTRTKRELAAVSELGRALIEEASSFADTYRLQLPRRLAIRNVDQIMEPLAALIDGIFSAQCELLKDHEQKRSILGKVDGASSSMYSSEEIKAHLHEALHCRAFQGLEF
jgi:hypothetical protein